MIFEAVGEPGMIDRVMAAAPPRSEIVVAGVCIPPDTFHPTFGIYKHLKLTFVLGWTPEQFSDALHALADGRIDSGRLVTATSASTACRRPSPTWATPNNTSRSSSAPTCSDAPPMIGRGP